MRKTTSTLLIALLLIQQISVSIEAKTVSEVQENIDSNQSEIQQINNELAQTQKKYEGLVEESKQIDGEIQSSKENISKMQIEIEEVTSEIPIVEDRASNTLKLLQKNSHVNYMVQILTSKSNGTDKLRASVSANKLTSASYESIVDLVNKKHEIETKKADLESLTAELEVKNAEAKAKSEELVALISKQESKLKSQEASLASQEAEKKFLENAGCKDGDVYGVDCGVKIEAVSPVVESVPEPQATKPKPQTTKPSTSDTTESKPSTPEPTKPKPDEDNDENTNQDSSSDQNSGSETQPPVTNGFRRPMRDGVVTNEYGGYDGYGGGHKGIDVANSPGTPIYAVAPGVVIDAGNDVNRGIYVSIIHNVNGVNSVSTYWHMSSATVGVGQSVTSDTQVGAVGSTGISTGPHLHFALDMNSSTFSNERAINPRSYISFPGQGTWFHSR